MVINQSTTRYEISIIAGGARYFLRRCGEVYGMLVTQLEARQLNRVLDTYGNSVHLDEAVHQFYERHARTLDEGGMVRPLN